MVGVVGDEDVALVELVDAEELEREAHRQRGREHELRDADRQRGEPALCVEDVALRSFDWLRIGVVAVRETYSAISKQTVSMPPRITSAVTGSTRSASEMRARLAGEPHEIDVRHVSSACVVSEPDVNVRIVDQASEGSQPAGASSKPELEARRHRATHECPRAERRAACQ